MIRIDLYPARISIYVKDRFGHLALDHPMRMAENTCHA